jgi:hypothetical protein
MEQPDKNTGERNLASSNSNFISERSNFNISKVENDSSNFLMCFSLTLILILNICFIIRSRLMIEEYKLVMEEEIIKFQQEIEETLDTQNKIITNYISDIDKL